MNNSVGAINPSGLFQYTPTCLSNNLDIDDIDMLSNPYSMDRSIFGGISPMMGGIFDPNKSYFDNMKDYQRQWNEYYVDQQKINRNNDVQINSPMEAIRQNASNLKDKILHDEQDQILDAYQNYYESVKNAYGGSNISDSEINSRALSLYTQLNGGKSLIQDLRENGHESFTQGFLQTLCFGFYAKDSAEDNISKITRQDVPIGEKVKQNAGRIAGITTIGAGVYGATKLLNGHTGRIIKAIGRFAKSKAGIISLVAAGAVAISTFFGGTKS